MTTFNLIFALLVLLHLYFRRLECGGINVSYCNHHLLFIHLFKMQILTS